jgi:23S rRNA (uridine2552-2'-O)-methyltransferase
MRRDWRKLQHKERFFRRAKEEGYRSRAAYKLIQINERHKIIRPGDFVLDLGSAPGGWSQVAIELAGPTGKVVAVDVVPMEPIPGVDFVQGDMADHELSKRIASIAPQFDVVLSDAAPKVSGVRIRDHVRSIALAEMALRLALNLLRPGGNLVVKVFEGEDLPAFLLKVRRAFRTVKPYSPPASRRESSEVYIVAKGLISNHASDKPIISYLKKEVQNETHQNHRRECER